MRLSFSRFRKLSHPRSLASLLFFSLLCTCHSAHFLGERQPHVYRDLFDTVRLQDEHGVVVAKALSLACHATYPLRLQVKLHSAAQVFVPTFVVSANNTQHVEIDGHIIADERLLAQPQHAYLQLREVLCRTVTRRGQLFYADAAVVVRALSAWLQLLAPPCHTVRRSAHGFSCELRWPELPSRTAALLKIKRRMVSAWQRQPYLLTRRLAIAIELSRLLAADDASRLPRFCRILQSSDPQELPLIFTSKRWQRGVCNQHRDNLSIAALGLELAWRELFLFKKLFERASYRGNVAVKLDAPMRNRFWVMLTPTAATLAVTVQQYQQVLAAYPHTVRFDNCWQPFFAENEQLAALAKAAGLHAGRCAATNYPQRITAEARSKFSSYLVASITSETEFVVSNGRMKFLHLPSGTYDYRISYLPNYYLPTSNEEVARGSMRWHNKRRNHQVLR